MESISTNFWNVINPSYGVRSIEVRSPILVALDASEETFEHLQRINDVYEFESASKHAHEAELKNQSSIQRFGFQLIRRFVTIIVSINIPSVLILVTLIGIVLWMLPPYREGFLEPMFQTFLARYGKYLVLAYISPKIPWAPLQRALKASTAAEYDEDGNHRGAISLQQNGSNRKKTPLGDVRIVTLSGHHSGDIKSIECTSSHGTIVSIGLEGELVLWDGVRGKWVARLDRVQRRRDVKTFNADVNPDYTIGNTTTGTRFSTGSVRKVAISSPIKCIKIDHSNQWIASGHENGVIRMWSISSSAWIRELTVSNNDTKLSGHAHIHVGNEENHHEMNGNVKVKSSARHDGVVALNFITAFSPSEYSAWDSPKVTRKHLAGKTQTPISTPTYLIAAYEDGYVREWDLESGECVNAIQNDAKSSITHLLVSDVKPRSNHGRQRIFAVSEDGNITCYGRRGNDVDDIAVKPYWRHLYSIKQQTNETVSSISAETSVDGTGIVVIGTEKGSVQVWNIANGHQLCTLAEGQRLSSREGKSGISVRMPRRQDCDVPYLRSSPSNEHNNESAFLTQQSHHQSAIQQIAISKHCRSDQFISNGGKADRCHRNEFLIASCATDGIVNIWRIDYSKGAAGDRCEQCGMGGNSPAYNHKKSSSSVYNFSDFSDTSQQQLQPNGPNREPIISLSEPSLTSGNNSTSANEQENGFEVSNDHTPANMVDIEQLAMRFDDMQVSKQYLGRVYQPGGHGVTWLKSTILAGVRRSSSNGHRGSQSKLGWEMWMAPMRKYEPHRRQRQNDSFGNSSSFYDTGSQFDVPVVTVNLNNDVDEQTGNEPENLGFVSRLLYTLFFNNGNSRPTRRRHASVFKARRKSAINAARLQRVRRKHRESSMASSKTEPDAILDEEMHTKELLPFTNITCLKSLDGDGLAFDFGNFVKVVWLDEQPLMFTMNDVEQPTFENESSPPLSLRSRHINTSNSKQNNTLETGSIMDHFSNLEDRKPPYLRRRSSSFTDLSRTRLPCGLTADAQCRAASCDTDCSYKLNSHFPTVVNTIVSKKFN
jgi:WD40 repeat protein